MVEVIVAVNGAERISKLRDLSHLRQLRSVISALARLKQEDCYEFKTHSEFLGYRRKLCLNTKTMKRKKKDEGYILIEFPEEVVQPIP